MTVRTKVLLNLVLGAAVSILTEISGAAPSPAVELCGAGSTLIAPLIGTWTKALEASRRR